MSDQRFQLHSSYEPRGDQPRAVAQLMDGLRRNKAHQTLLGVTGSGKTFTIANVVEQIGLPTLMISHNKTLAAQLYSELREFFPHNAVEYFVSYYDYYQPEAYIPQRDLYIEKDASINNDIDRLRLSATSALQSRRDVIIVASVSCIYGLGDPKDYSDMLVSVERGQACDRDDLLRRLVDIQYVRQNLELVRGTFRVRGDVVEIFPAYEETAYRVELFGDEVESIVEINPLTGEGRTEYEKITVYPAKHFVINEEKVQNAVRSIKDELVERVAELESQGKQLEAQRLNTRARYDCELLLEIGYCPGIENYSRHLTGRKAGEPPPTLINYFPDDFLLFIDESHVTVPQIGGMYRGDRSRKGTLVEFGFRLPSALDNRPLNFEEFESLARQVIYVSATPAQYEMENTRGAVVEQIIRPTGLMDPEVMVRSARTQVDNLLEEIRKRTEKHERVLVTTLTKRMAEDLTDYYQDLNVKVRYLHSDIETLERVEIIRDLRKGSFDVLVGINLLREGLDLPEVSLVAILDADKEGFLRSERSLIQTIGRASRNVNGTVILYADTMTRSMEQAISVTNRRRLLQASFNKEHKITPKTVVKSLGTPLTQVYEADYVTVPMVAEKGEKYLPVEEIPRMIERLKKEMKRAAANLEFEKAAELRDRIHKLQEREIGLSDPFVVRGAEG